LVRGALWPRFLAPTNVPYCGSEISSSAVVVLPGMRANTHPAVSREHKRPRNFPASQRCIASRDDEASTALSPGVGAAACRCGHGPSSVLVWSIGACTHLGYLPLIGGQSDPPRLSIIRRLFKRSGCACGRDIVVVLAKDFCRFANE
jgi:hypothetical protein